MTSPLCPKPSSLGFTRHFYKIYCGDCLDVMREMEDNSVDTVITDPPYALGKEPNIAEVLTHWLNGDDYEAWGTGFMNRAWDVVPGPVVWREVYRVLKPGGMCLVFGGTRTHDLTMIALRMAGFQIRDCISHFHAGDEREAALLDSMTVDQQQAYLELHYPGGMMSWNYGQGFPKSASVSKMIDRKLGMEREVVGHYQAPNGRDYSTEQATLKPRNHRCQGRDDRPRSESYKLTAPATDAAKLWDGWGSCGLKPSWEPIVVCEKPREGSYAEQALKWGVAGIWVDGARIGTSEALQGSTVRNDIRNGAYGKGHRPNPGDIPDYQQHPSGRWPANTLLSHHPDCQRRGIKRVGGISGGGGNTKFGSQNRSNEDTIKYPDLIGYADPDGLETVEAWECVEDCPVRMLGEQSSHIHSAGSKKKAGNHNRRPNKSVFDNSKGGIGQGEYGGMRHGDKGTAVRFFYCAKSSRTERSKGCDALYWRVDKTSPIGFTSITRDEWDALPERERARGNIHPTVKPLSICSYIATLTKTPTGGVILDPFAGSCTVALAAIETGRDWIMIEKEAGYVRIGEARVAGALREPRQMAMEGV